MSTERVRAGVPAGGQFAASTKASLGTDFLAGDSPEFDDAQLFEQAGLSARFFARKYGLDADDVAQETVLNYLNAMARRESGAAVPNPGGYIHATARSVALRSLSGVTRTEERAALKQYQQLCEGVSQRFGRGLTSEECDGIAERVRMNQPAGRRASAGFHRHTKEVPLSPENEGAVTAASHHGDEVAPVDFAPGSTGAQAEHLIAAGGKANHVQARRLAWDVVAEATGAPKVTAGSVNERAAASSRRIVAAAGGSAALAQTWYEGDATAEQSAALFAPFGQVGHQERKIAANLLRRRPAMADDLWNAALTSATTQRERI